MATAILLTQVMLQFDLDLQLSTISLAELGRSLCVISEEVDGSLGYKILY